MSDGIGVKLFFTGLFLFGFDALIEGMLLDRPPGAVAFIAGVIFFIGGAIMVLEY